jgi:hypothetical protein
MNIVGLYNRLYDCIYKTHSSKGNSPMSIKPIIGINMEPIAPPVNINKPFDVFTVHVFNEPKGDIRDTYEFDTKMEAHNFILGFMEAITFTHKKWCVAIRNANLLVEDTISNQDTL